VNLILCGFKGAGKSYFGKLLAERLGVPFIDTDRLIEARTSGMSCREIAHAFGEEIFRRIESEVIFELAHVRDSVIALGGGSLLDKGNAEFLKELGPIIYLEVSREKLENRVLERGIPSFFDPADLEGSFQKMIETREPHFKEFSCMQIHLDGRSDEEILTRLEEKWAATVLA
jgi:shikimate kinase